MLADRYDQDVRRVLVDVSLHLNQEPPIVLQCGPDLYPSNPEPPAPGKSRHVPEPSIGVVARVAGGAWEVR